MNSKLHKLLPISAAALVFASMAATASADTVVKIGHVAPLTGGIAHLGKDNEDGARLAVEEINAKGLTIGGQKVTLELDAQDDAVYGSVRAHSKLNSGCDARLNCEARSLNGSVWRAGQPHGGQAARSNREG